jgi:hypothetical protein
MDDFNLSSLHESKNEWGARLLTILTPLIIEGFKSIFEESCKLCDSNKENEKYLMTFQNFITRIPKWNATIIENEKKRIVEKSGCSYLEELITCIHIIQVKLLTAIRVGLKQKKIDINIPKIDDFIHKVYINVARKIYKNVYLFEINCVPLQIQKNNRELEIIVQECILNSVRESIPVETILRAYMDETYEEDVVEEIKEEVVDKPLQKESIENVEVKEEITEKEKEKEKEKEDQISLKFNDLDTVVNNTGETSVISAPKTIERLEEISALRNMQRKMDEEDESMDKLNISNESVVISDVQDLLETEKSSENLELKDDEIFLDDIEILG